VWKNPALIIGEKRVWVKPYGNVLFKVTQRK